MDLCKNMQGSARGNSMGGVMQHSSWEVERGNEMAHTGAIYYRRLCFLPRRTETASCRIRGEGVILSQMTAA